MQKKENSAQEERPVKKEKIPEEIEEAKIVTFKEKFDVLKHDLEKQNNANDIKTNNKLEEQDGNRELATILSNPKEQITGTFSV